MSLDTSLGSFLAVLGKFGGNFRKFTIKTDKHGSKSREEIIECRQTLVSRYFWHFWEILEKFQYKRPRSLLQEQRERRKMPLESELSSFLAALGNFVQNFNEFLPQKSDFCSENSEKDKNCNLS